MTGTPTDDDLLRIVGSDRDRHQPDKVAYAEAELHRRLQASDEEARDRIRTTGRVCIVLGLACVALPLLVVTSDGPGFEGEPLFSAAVLVQVLAGLLLSAGGFGLRRGRAWGVQMLLLVLWLALVWLVVFSVYFMASLAAQMPAPVTVGLGAFVVLIAAFWVFLLLRAQRFLRSTAVRRFVGEPK